MTRQKSKFLTFLFSFFPGFGQMYMGFMQRGISFLLLACFVGFLSAVLGIGELMIFVAVIFVYSFFDSINLMTLDTERFAMRTDKFITLGDTPLSEISLSHALAKKYLGIGLVIIGSLLIFNMLFSRLAELFYSYNDFIYHLLWQISSYLPRAAAAIIVIIIGVKLIKGKKLEITEDEKNA